VSKPELLLAAAAARTRRIRLGHAVIPLTLHHPVHVAERIATLDVLSGGRLEVGVGRGFSPLEYRVFGADMAASRGRVDETLDILATPLKRPHPRLWTAAVSPETCEWAAARGLGILAGPFKPWFMVRRDIARYRAAWRGTEPPRAGMTVGILCLEDGERARRLARDAFRWFYSELYRAAAPVLEHLYPGYESLHELGRFRALMKLGVDLGFADTFGMAIVGSPAEVRARIEQYARAGVTHLLCAFGAGSVAPAA